MNARRIIIVSALLLLAIMAAFVWRDQVRRSRHTAINFGLLNDDAYLKWLDGKSVTVAGDAGPFGAPGIMASMSTMKGITRAPLC
jgi:hypothetical protein